MASPLGLTNLNSTFINNRYGGGNDPNYKGEYKSLFNGTKFYHRPSANTNEANNSTSINSSSVHQSSTSNSADDLYDISTNSIINYTKDIPSMKLKETDFVFNRKLGVYPNNRLIVCRRFSSAIDNDLTSTNMTPLSTLVSWIPDNQDKLFELSSHESWNTYNEASKDPLGAITDIFNRIFSKVSGIDVESEGSGTLGGGIFKKFPVGGLAEALETEVTNYLLGEKKVMPNGDVIYSNGTNFSYDNLHAGNPNFLAESSYRTPNSIKSTLEFEIEVEYEMKYIKGIDPTIAFLDLLQNVLRFSSSESIFYMSQSGGNKINEFFSNYRDGKWFEAFSIIVDGIYYAVERLTFKVGNIISQIADVITSENPIDNLAETVREGLSVIGRSSISRYRIEFSKVIPAITGSPSGTWHVMIGNPKNPMFSSGDMIIESSNITFGNTMGFNDIPTRFGAKLKVKTARNLGIQEIFDKFNVGAGRQYSRNAITFQSDFYQGSVPHTTGATPSTGNPIGQ